MNQIHAQAPVDVKVLLIGNKSDLEKERKISYEQGLQVAGKYGIPFFECSAKTGLNVHELFNKIGSDIVDKVQKNRGTETLETDVNGANIKKVSSGQQAKKCCQ